MKYIVPAAVFLQMVSVGMSLRHDQMLDNVRRMTWTSGLGWCWQRSLCPRDWRYNLAECCR